MKTLSQLIQNAKIRKNIKKGFEPIDKIMIGGEKFTFGIPFLIEHCPDSKIKIKFASWLLDGILPHFKALNSKESFALTTAYDNIVDIKKEVKKKNSKIASVLSLKKEELVKSGCLIKDKKNLDLSVTLELDLKIEPLTREKVEQKRKSLWIIDFSKDSSENISKALKAKGIKIPENISNKKGALASLAVEFMSREVRGQLKREDKEKISEIAKEFSKKFNT